MPVISVRMDEASAGFIKRRGEPAGRFARRAIEHEIARLRRDEGLAFLAAFRDSSPRTAKSVAELIREDRDHGH